MKKAKGWIVFSDDMLLGLSKPAKGDYKEVSGVTEILFISARPTVFPDRKSAQRAIDNRKAWDELNGFEGIANMRVVTLFDA